MRHLCVIAATGLPTTFSRVVEAGPGAALATGLAALLTGAEAYTAIDVAPFFAQAGAAQQLADHFETIRSLLADRAPIPGPDEFPALRPTLETYDFPRSVLPDARLAAALAPERVAALRPDGAFTHRTTPGGSEIIDRGAIRYIYPWDATSVAPGSADLVFTQAVLQEIPHDPPDSALARAIRATAGWLRPGGVMSHQIDFGFYGAGQWNQHWTFGDFIWRAVRGRRSNYGNREPLSTYLQLLADCGMRVVAVRPIREHGVPHDILAPRFRALPKLERNTRSAHIVAVRDG